MSHTFLQLYNSLAYNDFGTDESILKEVIYHIENGSFSSTKSSHDIYRKSIKEIRNLKDELGSI